MSVKITSEYIELLNQAVARELQVSVQYMLQHTKMEKLLRRIIPENILLEKTTYETVGAFLKEFAIQEMKHAASIIERIYYLGGEATTKASSPTIGNSLSEFSKLGVKAEEEALILYRKIIDMSRSLGDMETHDLFEDIYADEEHHLFKFQEYATMEDEPESPEVEASGWLSFLSDDYFKLLNRAVAIEISAIIQYTNQHEKASLLNLRKRVSPLEVVTQSNKAQVVSGMLKPIFMQEMEHLEKISERIYLLGGEATTIPKPLPEIGKTADDFIRLDHKAENDTIMLYKTIIAEALKVGDTTSRHMFEEIIRQEEEHYWSFDDFL